MPQISDHMLRLLQALGLFLLSLLIGVLGWIGQTELSEGREGRVKLAEAISANTSKLSEVATEQRNTTQAIRDLKEQKFVSRDDLEALVRAIMMPVYERISRIEMRLNHVEKHAEHK